MLVGLHAENLNKVILTVYQWCTECILCKTKSCIVNFGLRTILWFYCTWCLSNEFEQHIYAKCL